MDAHGQTSDTENVCQNILRPARHSPDMTGIERRQDPRCNGPHWHVALVRDGQAFQKNFSDTRYGGEQEAKRMAQAWRDTIVAQYPAMSLAKFCSIPRSNNTSGIPGVIFCSETRVGRGGKKYQYARWIALFLDEHGRYTQRSFPLNKYSNEVAKRLATEERARRVAALANIPLRASQQPQPQSNRDDQETLRSKLRAPEEKRLQRAERSQAHQDHLAQCEARRAAYINTLEENARQRTTNTGEPYITAYDRKSGGKGVRVALTRDGKDHKKSFSYSRHGGEFAALEAAKAWRDAVLDTLPMISKAEAIGRFPTTAASGAAGVYRIWGNPDGKQWDAWRAAYPNRKGAPKRTKTFSIQKYGEHQAFEMAVKARADFMAELDDVVHVSNHAVRQILAKRAKEATGNAVPGAVKDEFQENA